MKLLRSLIALTAALVAVASPAWASQSSFVMPAIGPMSMSQFVTNHLNPGLAAIASQHLGTSAPANGPGNAPFPGQLWMDTSSNPWMAKFYDATQWVAWLSINPVTHAATFTSPLALSGAVTAAQITTNENDYTASGGSDSCGNKTVLRLSADATRTITGLSCGQADGTFRILENVASQTIVLLNQSASSVSANRFLLGSDARLAPNSSVAIVYDGPSQRWRPWGSTLVNTGVTAGAYGSATESSQCTFDDQGRATACASILVTPAWGSITSKPTTLAGYGITDAQGLDSDLTALASNSTNGFWARTGAGTGAARTFQAGAGLSVSNADGVSGNPSYAISDSELLALVGLTSAADKCPYFTGAGAAALADCVSFGRSLMGAASAAAGRSLLGVDTGDTPQFAGINLGHATDTSITRASAGRIAVEGSNVLMASDLGTAVAAFLATPSSTNLRAAITDETGTGDAVFGTAPTISGALLTGVTNVQQGIAFTGDTSPTQITANQNDYAPSGFSTATVVRINSDAARSITGLAGGADGLTKLLCNVGSFTITLEDDDAGSTAANRFAFGANLSLSSSACATLNYDSTSSRWRSISVASTGVGGGTVTQVTCEGLAITTSGTCPPRFGFANCTLVANAAGSALTIALKNAAGSDPSVGSPCTLWFRSVTATGGTWTQLIVTSAQSLVISSGSTLGATSSTAFRIWVLAFNDGGTFRLAAINLSTHSASTGYQIYPYSDAMPMSASAEGGLGAADSAGVAYAAASVTAKASMILGYLEWSSGGLTAGTWTTTNLLNIQTMGPATPKPGTVIQQIMTVANAQIDNSTVTPATAGTATITPLSAANLVSLTSQGNVLTPSGPVQCALQFARGSTQIGVGNNSYANGTVSVIPNFMEWIDKPNSASSTTYNVQISGGSGLICSYPYAGVSTSLRSLLRLQEIMGAAPTVYDNDNDWRLTNAVA